MTETVRFKYPLGIRARDRVTNQTGILDMRAEYLNGCIRYSLQPPVPENDPTKRPDGYWVDEQQLEKLDDGLNEKPITKKKTGGPTQSSNSARI